MKNFEFIKAPDVKAALALLDKEKDHAYLVAGSTNAMVDIRAGKVNDRTLIGIRDIDALSGIKFSRGKITIGAGTTISEIANSALLAKKAPALFQAANDFADPTTRNSATIGGNIANASPAADTAPPLLALKAEVIIAKKGSKRRVPMEDFFLGVNKTVLEKDELILAVEFSANPHSAFYKVGLRNAMAISVVTAAASVRKDRDGKITDVAIALGSVAPKPVRAYNAEKAVLGKKLDDKVIADLMKAVAKDISPIDDVRASAEYRKDVAPVIVKRVLCKSCGICANEGGTK
ncbi:MAG: xanthine dehydrogenase family protein subunit M [Firmicutes bacterium]|nr:xanthine dehydrogenase family protein subunit M [Bacillota bacterium]